MSAVAHRTEVRVYYEDTDFSGSVYHASYLRFMERGRTEFLRDLGIHHSELIGEGIAFAVRSMQIEFVAAARIDDVLVVETMVEETSGVRMRLRQRIERDGVALVTAEVVVVAIRAGGGATRLPKALRERVGGG